MNPAGARGEAAATREPASPAAPASGAGTRGEAAVRRALAAGALAWRSGRSSMLTLAALALAGGVLPVAVAWLTRSILDQVGARGPAGPLLVAGVALAGTGVAVAAVPYWSRYAGAELDRRVGLAAHDRLFRALNGLRGLARLEDPRFRDRLHLAEHLGRRAPSQVMTGSLGLAQAVVGAAGFLGTLLAMSPAIAGLVALSAAPTLWVHLSISRQQATMISRSTPATRRRAFYAQLLSSNEAAKEVRLFGLGEFFRGRMLAEFRAINEAERVVGRRERRSMGMLAILGAAVAGGGLVWMIVQARAGRFTIGDISVFVASIAGVQAATGSGIQALSTTHQALLLFDHFQAIVTARPDLPTPRRPRPVPPMRYGIELRDVWFRYGDGQPWILRGVDLAVPRGDTVALVGLNGAGKSTLVKLLCRLYDPERGSIRWDGVDLREVDPAELRSRITAVFQDFHAYDLPAAENIGLGDLARLADRPGIEAAAARAGIHEMLCALPYGYDTQLSRMFFGDGDESDDGVLLSGGQWQRVALARALLRDEPDLVILDEPSSGLDALAEAELHAMLRRHRAGRTALLISHRLNTVRDADTIVVLADGVVAELGRHDELVASGAGYARLFATQARGFAEAAVS